MIWLICFVAGVVATLALPLPEWRLPLALAALLWPWRAYLPWRPALVAAMGLALGLGWAGWRIEQRRASLLPPAWELRAIEFEGAVRGVPQASAGGSSLTLEVERVLTKGAVLPRQVRLFLRDRPTWPAASRWRVTARFRGAHATANPYGFDAERWMWANDVLASGAPLMPARRLDDAGDMQGRIDRARAGVVERIRRVLGPSREGGLIAALTVGVQHGIDRRDWQLFARTGVTHLMAISGLHIGIVAGIAGWLAGAVLKRLPPRRLAARLLLVWISLAAAAVYATLAGLSVPTRRTLCTLAAITLMLQLRRAFTSFQLWWGALAAVLLFDPFAVLAPGLWLSFGMVAALLIVARGRRRPPGHFHAALLAQWATGVLSLVPLLLFFGKVPLLSPLANLLAIPYVSLLLTPLALLAVALPLDGPLQVTAWLCARLLDGLALLGNGPQFAVPGLPGPVWLGGLCGALWLIAPRGVPGRGLALLLLLPLGVYRPPLPDAGVFRVTVFDVGQGLSVLIATERHRILFDTGALAAEAVLLPQLAGLGVSRLDMAILSHHDFDHDGAAPALLQAVPAERVLAGQPESWRGAVPCRPGQRWQWDGVRFVMLAPASLPLESGNNARSCVLLVSGRYHAALLTGDIPAVVEEELVRQLGRGLAATILLVPHHGSRSSSSAAFLDAVRPRWAIVSAGYRNRFAHPHPEVLRRYRERGIRLLRTDLDGAITLEAGALPTVSTFRGDFPRYWRAPPGT
ncbi:DNA internalization-related competence protein ComEC/Rec2 [Paludibacterium yongneupense]|uniref:DNA internalization-related competence protein ComEC/Rec2 n=1 Tax=Paludibacterium yongneupense TaxID=400061 RepID=UPI000415FD90|nr:DNA internalization-related competence protein ComEC/Rec2 [Paludibacterium yongneupense]